MHSVYPIRGSMQCDVSDWSVSGRFLQAFIQFPEHEFQIVTVYGFPACTAAAKQRTNQLLAHALQCAFFNTFPMILCGDFNHRPSQLDSLQPLWHQGFRTAEQLHMDITGQQLPTTFKDATRHDVAIFSPQIVQYIKEVWVNNQQFVAGHNPLYFSMHLPSEPLYTQNWRLPKCWVGLDPQPDLIAEHFRPVTSCDEEDPLMQWSTQVEKAVHLALKTQLTDRPTGQYPGLPRTFRGRAQPRKIVRAPLPRSMKPAWAGHYTPCIDQPTIQIKQRTRQIRRLQSLRHRVRKWELQPRVPDEIQRQLWQEWSCILRAPGFPGGFLRWMRQFPEIPHLPLQVPNEELLHDLEQLLRFHLDQQVYSQRQQ